MKTVVKIVETKQVLRICFRHGDGLKPEKNNKKITMIPRKSTVFVVSSFESQNEYIGDPSTSKYPTLLQSKRKKDKSAR